MNPSQSTSSSVTSVRPEKMVAFKEEVKKLIATRFIRYKHHADWVANITTIIKKNEKIRVCINLCDINNKKNKKIRVSINFCNLNMACPKVEFSVSIVDDMIDNMCGFCACYSRMGS